jgi:glycosyltransferase involved in cell wall biosynthesis
MLISVVIPTHARPEGLTDLLRSLSDQEFAQSELEIHVVSNFEEDPSSGIVDRFHALFQNLYWHYAGEKGANRARNLGLQYARGEIVLLLDDDCVVPHRYYLSDVLKAHRENPEMVAIGGGYFAPVDANAAELAYNHIADVWLKRRSEDGGKCVNLVGGNVSYKRALMNERQFKFKDDIVFGGAETELHLRMFRAGSGLLYLPELRVEHRARINGLQLLRKGFKQGMASHARWSTGLHVATRIPQTAIIPSLPPLARFWKDTFDRAFAMGSDHVRIKPAPRKRDWAVRLLGRSIYTHIKRALYRWKFGQLERRNLVSMPLQRFYVLPVSDQCRYSCNYCESLGCKKVAGPLEDELKKAKIYGFTEVLLPCNATFTPGLEDMVEKIQASGLKPSLLVNGDSAAQIDLEKAKRLADSLSFHLLLARPAFRS